MSIGRRKGRQAIHIPVEIDYLDVHPSSPAGSALTPAPFDSIRNVPVTKELLAYYRRGYLSLAVGIPPSLNTFVTGGLSVNPAIVLDSSDNRFFLQIPSYNPLQVSGLAGPQIFMIE